MFTAPEPLTCTFPCRFERKVGGGGECVHVCSVFVVILFSRRPKLREVTIADVTAEMWQQPRGAVCFPCLCLFQGCVALLLRALLARLISGLRGQTACAIAMVVMRQERSPPNQLSRSCCITLAHLMVRSTRVTSSQGWIQSDTFIFSCNLEAHVLM